jgi:hypothetical protein
VVVPPQRRTAEDKAAGGEAARWSGWHGPMYHVAALGP